MKRYQLSDVLTFLTEYDRTKASFLAPFTRYYKYKKYKSNYSFYDEDNRHPLDLLIEFLYQYSNLNRLFMLSTKDKYSDMIKIKVRPINIRNESSLLSYTYNFIRVSFMIPDYRVIFEWDDIDHQLTSTINDKKYITNRDEHNDDVKNVILRCTTHFYDELLDDYWLTDKSELNGLDFRVKSSYISNVKIIQEYSECTDSTSLLYHDAGDIYIDDSTYCFYVSFVGHVTVLVDLNKWVFFKYSGELYITYESYTLRPLRDSIIDYLKTKEDDIASKAEESFHNLLFWTNVLTL